MSTTWKILTWSRIEAPPELVWPELTNARRLLRAVGPGWTATLEDADALTLALRGAKVSVHHGAGGPDWAIQPLRIEVVDGIEGLRVSWRVQTPLVADFIHRRRLERAIGGAVRWVDEIVLTPGWRPSTVAAWSVGRAMQRHHRATAALWGAGGEAVAQVRRYRLGAGNLDQASPLFEDIAD